MIYFKYDSTWVAYVVYEYNNDSVYLRIALL